MKYYAVKNGRKKGIFLTWDECKESVDGYPSATFKSFKTKEDAEAYLGLRTAAKTKPNWPEKLLFFLFMKKNPPKIIYS